MNTLQRELVFLDSSVITKYFMGYDKALNIIESDMVFAVNDVVYSEVVFNLLRARYFEKYGRFSLYGLRRRITAKDIDITKAYDIVIEFFSELEKENRLQVLATTKEIILSSGSIAREYGLLPNDALITATCKHYNINTIATFDEDFKRVPWLKVIP